jgi:hypothetical protein
MSEVSLDSKKFEDFIRILSVFKELSNDVDIRGGTIRQKSNNTTMLFDIDLSHLLGNIDLPITNIKQKLDLFKSFIGQDVNIESSTKTFSFTDKYSSFVFKKPHSDFLNNKFLDLNMFNSLISINIDDRILETTISKIITDRIRVSSQVFNKDSLTVEFGSNNASIMMISGAKDQKASLINDIPTDVDLAGNTSSMHVQPMVIDHDGPIILSMYMDNEPRTLSEFNTSITDTNIRIYYRSRIDEKNSGGK